MEDPHGHAQRCEEPCKLKLQRQLPGNFDTDQINQQQCDICGIWVSQAGNLQVGAPALKSTGATVI
jgi:hypothetical protein